MRELFILSLTLALMAGFSTSSWAVITGSVHDFSRFPGLPPETQICVNCHAPHNVATPVIPPLWNHELSIQTYTVYTSPTLDATVGQPGGSSKLCLSCHDGTVAVDSFGGATGDFFITGPANLGTDLSNDHPISFVYDSTLATADPGLWNPEDKTVTIGSGVFTKTGTIQEVMLQADQVQCASCHDVHNDFVEDPTSPTNSLLVITKAGSKICLACHNK